MRYQPQGLVRGQRGLDAIAFVFGNSHGDAFGRASEMSFFAAPAKDVSQHGLARKFVAASSQYATVTPPASLVNFSEPFAVVFAFVGSDVATTMRLAHYGETATSKTIQVLTIGSRLAYINRTGNGASTVSSTDLIENGKPYVVVTGFDGSAHFMYINGVAQAGPASATIANPATGTTINIARRADNLSYFAGQIALFAHIKGKVDALALSANPWQLFAAPEEDYEVAAAAGTDTNVTPGTGALTVSGNAPSVARTANQSVSPATGALLVTGTAPTVARTDHKSVTPGTGAMVVTGYAPAVTRTAHIGVTPGAGALTITGRAPAVSQSQPAADARYARPGGTISAGAWLPSTGTSLGAMLDEPSADAADFIYTNTPGTVEVMLNPVKDPGTSSGQVMRYQVWSAEGSGGTMRLKQGAAVIAAWTHSVLPATPTVFARPLSAAQCDSITDYTDLRFEFTAA